MNPNPSSLSPEQIQQGLFARSRGLLSEQIGQKRVLVAGVGSVGSFLAEQLVRSGVGALTLIDPDIVELSNLSRTTYTLADLGKPKVMALRDRLHSINPGVAITAEPCSLFDYEPAALDTLVQAADLIIGTTDDVRAQRSLNRFAYGRGKPALFIGLYPGAQGGEVIVTVPEQTACYLCAAGTRRQFEETLGEVSGEVDYGTGRLMGEVAIAADIQHVTTTAIKMALSLLLPDDADVKLKDFLKPVLATGQTFLTFSTVPNYWFYPHLFGDTPGQFAYQSVCLTPERQETCPVCGAAEHRVEPLAVPLKAPDLLALRFSSGDAARLSGGEAARSHQAAS